MFQVYETGNFQSIKYYLIWDCCYKNTNLWGQSLHIFWSENIPWNFLLKISNFPFLCKWTKLEYMHNWIYTCITLMIPFTAEQINLHIFQYDMKYLVNQCTLRCSSIWSIRAWKKSKASCCSLMLTVWPQSLNTFQKRSGSWYWSLLSSKCPNTCWIWKNTLKK